jgi:hypothetical protein
MVFIIGLMYNLPIRIRHLINLAFPPKDLYKPILIDEFPFNREGISKEYKIKPKFIDYHEIGFTDESCSIPSTYRFNGEIRLELIQNEKSIFEKDITAMESASYFKDDMNFYEKVVLTTFQIPSKKSKEGLILKISVLKKDDKMDFFIDKIKLYVAVSSRP